MLLRFLKRPRGELVADRRWSWADLAVPFFVVATALAITYSSIRPVRTPTGQMNLEAFGRLPVMYEGRMKPLDTLARNSLRALSDSETFVDDSGKRQPAVKWLLDVISDAPEATKYHVVRIQNLEVLDIFGLTRREGYRYAIDELREHIAEFEKQVKAAQETPAAERSAFQKKIMELENRLRIYLTLDAAFEQLNVPKERLSPEVMQELVRRQGQMFLRHARAARRAARLRRG